MAGCDGGIGRGDASPFGERDAAVAPDPCAAPSSSASSTVGCNGGFASPAPNEVGGACERPDPDVPRGTCGARAVCVVPRAGENMCMTVCAVADDYVSTGSCPRGHRCFRVRTADDELVGICYRDCDAEHPCPDGWICDPDGGCDVPG